MEDRIKKVWEEIKDKPIEYTLQKIAELEDMLKGACQKYHAKCDYLQKQIKEQREYVVRKIIDKYNLDNKPIVDEFGDTSFGYASINAKRLKEFLLQILEETDEES